MENNRPIAVDLFAGGGGMTLGLEQAGFDVLASLEIDPVHCATHEYNFPFWQIICRSITDISGSEIRDLSKIGDREIDAVFGGPPCQGFSLMGKRVFDDPRNTLVFEFIRLVAELEPKYFVMENVPGMAVGKHQDFLHKIFDEFTQKGYLVQENYQILNAACYGIPQNRSRLFILGCRQGLNLPQYPPFLTQFTASKSRLIAVQDTPTGRINCGGNLRRQPLPRNGVPDAGGVLRHFRSPRWDGTPVPFQERWGRGGACLHFVNLLPKPPTVRDAIQDLPEVDRYPELQSRDWMIADFGQPTDYVKKLRNLAFSNNDFSYPRYYDPSLLTSSFRTKHTDQSIERFTQTKPGNIEPISHFYKLSPDGLCNTLRAGTDRDRGAFTSPRPIHYSSPRCITVREAARLHSYPDWFRFHVTKWHGFRQVGNSVPPALAKAIALEIIQRLDITPTQPLKTYFLGDEKLLSFKLSQAARYYQIIGKRD